MKIFTIEIATITLKFSVNYFWFRSQLSWILRKFLHLKFFLMVHFSISFDILHKNFFPFIFYSNFFFVFKRQQKISILTIKVSMIFLLTYTFIASCLWTTNKPHQILRKLSFPDCSTTTRDCHYDCIYILL